MLLFQSCQSQSGVCETECGSLTSTLFKIIKWNVPKGLTLNTMNQGDKTLSQISCRRESHGPELTPVVVPEREFYSGKKFRNIIT